MAWHTGYEGKKDEKAQFSWHDSDCAQIELGHLKFRAND